MRERTAKCLDEFEVKVKTAEEVTHELKNQATQCAEPAETAKGFADSIKKQAMHAETKIEYLQTHAVEIRKGIEELTKNMVDFESLIVSPLDREDLKLQKL